MTKRFQGFDIKAAAVLIIVAVAVFTSVRLTRQIKPASGLNTPELKRATLPSQQLEELREPLPHVTTQSKQETQMAFTSKRGKDPFVPDWPIRPREDKSEAKAPIEITRIEADAGRDEYGEFYQLPKELYEPREEPHMLSDTATLPLTDEDFSEGIDEGSGAVMDHVAAENEEHAEFEDELAKIEGRPKETAKVSNDEIGASEITDGFIEGEGVYVPAQDIPSKLPAAERETAVEQEPDWDVAEDDEPEKQELKPVVDPPRLFVTGIIVSGDVSYAIVSTPTSSVVVQPGDEIEGATVKSVDGKAVVVVKQDEEFVLELGGGGES
ncbi:MAG: hypothetical protein GX872_09300 [Firmicutes bacterium]|nr:hypothetical protein [Bacillota bacterium]HXL03754.1 hypothetical protein [Bacillota bacterium]